jgi:hypothetical protein
VIRSFSKRDLLSSTEINSWELLSRLIIGGADAIIILGAIGMYRYFLGYSGGKNPFSTVQARGVAGLKAVSFMVKRSFLRW